MNRLKEWRQLRGLTQEELAKASGVALRTVSRYETGKTEYYSFKVLKRLAVVLKIRPGDLLEG